VLAELVTPLGRSYEIVGLDDDRPDIAFARQARRS
jgi:hypothetical protein